MIRKLILSNIAVSLVYLVVVYAVGFPDRLFSVGAGLLLVALNLPLVIWTWAKIFAKKSIALAVSVIVFKYAIFGAAIYIAVSRQEIDDLWFFIGLTSVIPTVVIYALQSKEEIIGEENI